MPGVPQRSDVVAMLATYGDRQPEQVPEAIDSLELAWLIHQIEQRTARWTSTTTCSPACRPCPAWSSVLTDLRVGSVA